MKRPNQHPLLETFLCDHAIERLAWQYFARIAMAPPNLRFLAVALDRLLNLADLPGDHFGDLPEGGDERGLRTLHLLLRDAAPKSHTSDLRPLFEAPGLSEGAQKNPLFRYCISEFPTWCALALASPSNCAVAFDRVAACMLGEVMRYAGREMDQKSYADFIVVWQARHEQEHRSDTERPQHPLAKKISCLGEIERGLRNLSRPEHHDAWTHFLGTSPGVNANPLDDPDRWAAGFPDTLESLRSINTAWDRLESESGRGGRRLSQVRRNPHLVEYGPGCYSRKLDWLIHLPDNAGEQSTNGQIKSFKYDARRLLVEDYPFEEMSTPTGIEIYVPEERDRSLARPALVVKSQWQHHVQMWNNQLLPWTFASITACQLAEFFRVLHPQGEDRNALSDAVLRERMAWCATFNTGFLRASICDELVISLSEFETLGSRIEYLWDRRLFRVAVNLPQLVGLEDAPDGDGRRRITNYLHIADRVGFHLFAEPWLARQAKGSTRVPVFSANWRTEEGRRDHDVAASLKNLGISETLIQQALPRKVHAIKSDVAAIALWGDFSPIHTATLRHYLSPDSSCVEKSIDQAALSLIDEAKKVGGNGIIPYVDEVRHFSKPRRIGAPNCPSQAEVLRLVDGYRRRLENLPVDSLEGLRAYHDAYLSYHVFFQAAALGYRAVVDPAPVIFQVGSRYFALFVDKDSEGFHRRIVPVPGLFLKQQRYFEDHRRLMESISALRIKAATPVMFSLGLGRPVAFRPTDAVRNARDLWPYRLNALRRRMRTRLFERGGPGEAADAWMGHWFLGNCPWMSGSGFQVDELVKLVEEHLSPILADDGWRPIKSAVMPEVVWATA